MADDSPSLIRRYTANYYRGALTQTEFVVKFLDLLAATDPSPDAIEEAFNEVPDELISKMRWFLDEYVEVDYYFRTFAIGDDRTLDQINAQALERQAKLPRICAILNPLIAAREGHNAGESPE